jgi:hypothetical protein
MKDGHSPCFNTKMGISKAMQGTPNGAKEHLVISTGVPQADIVQMVWHSEDDVIMLYRKRGILKVFYPQGLLSDLAFWAVPVTTAVIAIAHFPTAIAHLLMSTHPGSSALGDIVQRLYLSCR